MRMFSRFNLALGIMMFFIVTTWAGAKTLVVIDAAHGGNDSGIQEGNEIEKDWNLKIAKVLEKAFADAGDDVVMTRKRDETMTPEKRADLINTSKASVILVIHADREWTGTQKGPILVVEPPNRTDNGEPGEIQRWGVITPAQFRSSLKLARSIAQKLGINGAFSTLSDSRGTAGEVMSEEGRIYCLPHQSLRTLSRPAVVLTPLFLTNASDVKKFSNADSLADFAAKVVQGTSDYLQGTP